MTPVEAHTSSPPLVRRACPSPWRGRGESDETPLRRRRLLVQAVPQDAARQCTGMAPVLQKHLAIDDGVVDALSEFPNAPAASRKVVHCVFWQWVDGVGIKDRDVSCQPGTE